MVFSKFGTGAIAQLAGFHKVKLKIEDFGLRRRKGRNSVEESTGNKRLCVSLKITLSNLIYFIYFTLKLRPFC